MTDEHHDNSYEDTGELTSRLAHIAYAEWRGPDFAPSPSGRDSEISSPETGRD